MDEIVKWFFGRRRANKVDGGEWFVGAQLSAGSRQEAIDLTGDDTFYPGDDGEEGLDDDSDDRDDCWKDEYY